MNRPTCDEYFIKLAVVIATRATCLRRAVGCVLVNARGHVLATGYNGRAAGLPHCNETSMYAWAVRKTKPNAVIKFIDEFPNACAGARVESGTQLDSCEAIHAEQNALLQCRDVYQIETCYVTVSPCVTCVKLLLNTTCSRIVFAQPYAHDEQAKKLWLSALSAGQPVRQWLNQKENL